MTYPPQSTSDVKNDSFIWVGIPKQKPQDQSNMQGEPKCH